MFNLKVTLTAISVTTTVERGLLRIVSTVQDKCSQAANCSSNCLAISAARVRPCPPVKTPAGELLRRPTRLLRPEEQAIFPNERRGFCLARAGRAASCPAESPFWDIGCRVSKGAAQLVGAVSPRVTRSTWWAETGWGAVMEETFLSFSLSPPARFSPRASLQSRFLMLSRHP